MEKGGWVYFIPDKLLRFRCRRDLSSLTSDEEVCCARQTQQHKQRRANNAIADTDKPMIAVVGMPLLSSFFATVFLVWGTVFSLGVVSDEESGFLSSVGEEGSPKEGDGFDFTDAGGAGVTAAPGDP